MLSPQQAYDTLIFEYTELLEDYNALDKAYDELFAEVVKLKQGGVEHENKN